MPKLHRLSALLRGRDTTYFELFEAAAANAAAAAVALQEFLSEFPEKPDLFGRIVDLEHEGDRITHEIVKHLNQTFVTPLEREDVLMLVSALDDVVDLIEEAADYLGLYSIEAPTAHAEQLADIIVKSTAKLAEAMPRLRTFEAVHDCTVAVNELENEGDRIVRKAMAALFIDGADPMVVIRWKDVYERLEGAIDACETVANVLEGIVIKNA